MGRLTLDLYYYPTGDINGTRSINATALRAAISVRAKISRSILFVMVSEESDQGA